MPAPAFSTASGRLRPPGSIAGWCRPRRSASICASAWPMASACSGCRCRARSGCTAPKVCADMSLLQELFTTTCDWRVASMGWMYTLFFVLLGVSAAIWGGWLERSGPRKAGFVAALCWCGGLVLGAIGIYTASALAAVARLRRDRRHRARARLHLAGVDAGQMVSRSPRHGDRHGDHGLRRRRHDRRAARQPADELFQDAAAVGVWQTFLAMAAIYFVFMMIGAFSLSHRRRRLAPDGWTPPERASAMITQHHVHLRDAHKTKQFWLIWTVLCLNVSAGIGVIGMASPMLQEIFAGTLIGLPGRQLHAAVGRAKDRDRRRSPPASPGCCRCSISAGGSSGRRCRTISAARTPITCSSCSASRSTRWRRLRRDGQQGCCSCSPSASSCRCMAAASPPCRPISPTSSAPSSSAPFMAGC